MNLEIELSVKLNLVETELEKSIAKLESKYGADLQVREIIKTSRDRLDVLKKEADSVVEMSKWEGAHIYFKMILNAYDRAFREVLDNFNERISELNIAGMIE